MIKKLSYIFASFLLMVIILFFFYIRKISYTLPSFSEIKQMLHLDSLDLASQVYDRNNQWIGSFSIKKRYLINLKDLPNHLINAIISAEDKNFYSHIGLDLKAILRALYINMTYGYIVQGASTISQQLARSFFLNNEKSYTRKIKELILAIKIESILSKNDILELYLNKIYFGNRSYGIEAASRSYFNKHATELNIGEASLLAGLPKAPSYYAPHVHFQRAIKRQKLILRQMYYNHFISKKELSYWLSNPPLIAETDSKQRAGYFIDMVKNEIYQNFSLDNLKVSGLNVYTSIDIDYHEKLKKRLSKINFSNLKNYPDTDYHGIELSIISILPKTGDIFSIFGGQSYHKTQFNRALHTKRPIHQLLAPFIYAFAIEQGVQAHDIIDKINPLYQDYFPTQNESIYHKILNINNMEYESILSIFGTYQISVYLKEVGFSLSNDVELWIPEKIKSTPMTLASVYSSLFNEGKKTTPFTIRKIETNQNKYLFERKTQPLGTVLNSDSAYALTYMLNKSCSKKFPFLKSISKNITAAIIDIDTQLHNGWLVFNYKDIINVVWIGSEFGRSKIAKTKEEVTSKLNFIAQQIIESIKSSDMIKSTTTTPIKLSKNISFGRFKLDKIGYVTLPVLNL